MEALTPAFPPRSLCETDESYGPAPPVQTETGLSRPHRRGGVWLGSGRSQRWSPRSRPPSLVFGGFQSHLHGHRHRPMRPEPDRAPRRPGRLSPDLPTALSTSPVRATVTPPGARAGAWGAGLSSERGRGGFARRDTSSGSWGTSRFRGTAHGGASADTALRPGDARRAGRSPRTSGAGRRHTRRPRAAPAR